MDLTASPVVTLSRARLSYPTPEGDLEVLKGIDLQIAPGEIVAVTGPSGSGKSSLIAVIGGLEPVSDGEVRVLGTDMLVESERGRTLLRRRDIGIVFQAYHLVPSMTAQQNAALPLTLAGAENAQARATAMLERVGLGHRLTHRPSALSGGEQQRVAIARAFVAAPRLVLADEPTGNLDQRTGEVVIETMFELARSSGAALLLVTHDPALAARCDRTLVIEGGRVVS
ncbi:ABC transporter ATP-binding protein [Thalassobaculum sp. OXR-137]|uniref:ABC transporter ATP-binding protein n=1 Tax=Thalassobaculum sp. OXR-137 TaxID=3100173 RepID=UPI002AC9A464|nr:ABC transporter ATP-binding protein [Thalassobaculum sp. OXR-137]WPZ32333.1 ABC transporter ATP-binding protein [Thalassobaculum sp. OXR-137]